MNIVPKDIFPYLIIVILSLLFLIPFTGNVHLFDWDEINFAECAREMMVTHSYHTPLLNFQPFWEKPPLFIWMQVLSMKLLGINEWGARFPNIINGVITLCLLYYFGKKWYHPSFGILWAMIHFGTFLPHFYFRSGIIDPWYNLFGFLFLMNVLDYLQNHSEKTLYIGSIMLGLALLTKGPAMLLIIGLTILIFFIIEKINLMSFHSKEIIIALFLFLLTGSSWFLYEYLFGNKEIISAFIDYQIRLFKTEDSGHGGFFLYHFIVLLIGCFPASVLILNYLSKNVQKDFYSKSMLILLFVVLIIFSIVKTKIVHYSSMAYFPISFLSAYILYNNYPLYKFQKYLLLFISFLLGLILILAANIENWKYLVIPYLKKTDVFAAENLKTSVQWYGYEFLSGFFLILIILWYIYKSQYTLNKNYFFFGMLIIWISFTINTFAGKIEQYTQNNAIIFFKYCADKNYTVDTYGYKSYAPLFYGKRKIPAPHEQNQIKNHLQNLEQAGYDKIFSYNLAYLNWLIYDTQKYPVFLVCKIQDEKNVRNTGKFVKLYSKSGYVLFMKQPIVQ